jgi:hypothetical protein
VDIHAGFPHRTAALPAMVERALRVMVEPRVTAERVLRVMAEPRVTAERADPATAVAAVLVAAGTTRRRAVADTPPVVDTPPEAGEAILVAEVIRVVAAMAEAIAKKLGDAKSLREATRCR